MGARESAPTTHRNRAHRRAKCTARRRPPLQSSPQCCAWEERGGTFRVEHKTGWVACDGGRTRASRRTKHAETQTPRDRENSPCFALLNVPRREEHGPASRGAAACIGRPEESGESSRLMLVGRGDKRHPLQAFTVVLRNQTNCAGTRTNSPHWGRRQIRLLSRCLRDC